MLSVKQKLHSKNGASMIMAMVFLMFCLLIGGSVLSMATANSSRIQNMAQDQQEYYSQRSAIMMMADMLTDENGKELQALVTEVRTGDAVTCTITSSSFPESGEVPFLQKVLFETIVSQYLKKEGIAVRYSDFTWIHSVSYVFAPTKGTLQITGILEDGSNRENLTAYYDIQAPDSDGGSKDYTFHVDFGEGTSHLVLDLDGSVTTGKPKTVTVGGVTTTTTSTVIRWGLPVVQKKQVTLTNQAGGT